MLSLRSLLVGSLLFVVACGGSDPQGNGATGGGGNGSGATTAAAGPGATTGATGGPAATTLIGASWTVPPGSEIYQCTRLTLTEDTYVSEFYPVIPLGTHHTVVTLDDSGKPDGTSICADPFEGGPRMIYGTGVGSVPQIFPEGTAVKIGAGEQIVLNLHLFNTGSEPLSGESRIDVVTLDAQEVVHESQVELFGKTDGLVVTPNGSSTQTATCTVASDLEVFIVQPHMHQLGTHLRTRVTPPGGATEDLFDAPYDFDAQVHLALTPPRSLHAGDVIDIECTYDNPTAETVTFGESSTDEMCFLGLFLYPSNQPFCQ